MAKYLRILNVANKQLPDHDYRIQYHELGSVAHVRYGLPGKPASLKPEEYIELGFSEGISLADIKHFYSLAKHLRRHGNQYDLIHFFSTKLQLFGPLFARMLGVGCVSTITGFGRTFNRQELRYRLLRPFYLLLLRLSVLLSKAVLFQNHGDMRWLAKKLPRLVHKMHWIGSGVEADVTRQKDFAQQQLTVLMVARLMPDKGVNEFLDVARQLHGEKFRFLLVGPESVGQENLYHQVQVADEQGTIEYLGELGQQDLSLHYQKSHVFVFPSHGEGMPRVMLEAGHALMCPIASDIPAHRDLIHEGAGLLISKEQKVKSLIDHLNSVQEDRAKLEKNAMNYQQHILKNYTVTAYAQRMDKLLMQLLPSEGKHCRQLRSAA